MKRVYFYLLLVLLFNCTFICAQKTKGYIINIEGEKIYVDLTSPVISVGDELGVYVAGGYMTHPVTKQRVKKADELICKMVISSIYADYSIALAHDPSSLNKIKAGQVVQLIEKATKKIDNSSPVTLSVSSNSDMSAYKKNPANSNTSMENDDRIAVVIAPAEINDVVNSGHFGGYVADVLMEQLLMNNKVRLLDRSVLNAQLDEVDLAGNAIDPSTAIQRGKIVGARYIIQVTMQKPDVVNIRTGIPLASVMGTIGMATGKNVGAQYASNMQMGNLKAAVNISTRVVDLQTGEVLFMTSGTGKAQGKAQLALEYGALGGAEINGGADGFKQTITGKAIQKAFLIIGRNLDQFFSGHIDKKVVGSAGGFGNYGQNLASRGSKLYLGTEALDKDGIQMLFTDRQDLFFRYKSAKKTKAWGFGILTVGIAGGAVAGAVAGLSDTEGTTVGCVIGGCVLVGITGLTLCCISSNRSIKNIVKDYNRSQEKTADWHLDFTTSGNGLGIRLIF